MPFYPLSPSLVNIESLQLDISSKIFKGVKVSLSLPSILPPHPFQYWWWHHMAFSWATGTAARDTCTHQDVCVWNRPLFQTGGGDRTGNRSADSRFL